MKNPMLLLASSLVILLSACKDKEKVVTDESVVVESGTANAGQNTAPAATTDQLGGPNPADSLVFLLEHTPCFGTCKAYRVNIYRSGYATFEGRSNVDKEGMHYGTVSSGTVNELLQQAQRIGFFDMQDKYDSPVTDLPSSIIRVVAGGKDKKVIGRVGAPEPFKAFVAQAEELLYPLDWKAAPKAP